MRLIFGLSVDESSGPFLVAGLSGCWDWYRPYFENYTVDASILETMHLCVVSQTNDRKIILM